MDFGAIGENFPLIAAAVGLILLQILMRRRRRPERTQGEIVQNLLSEVSLNQALVESSHLRQKPKKIETVSWQRSKAKIGFLDASLQVALSDAFTMAEDFNQQIDAAKKHKSASYMASVDMDRLKGPLARSKEGLEQWLVSTTGGKEPPAKYPSVFDGFSGG